MHPTNEGTKVQRFNLLSQLSRPRVEPSFCLSKLLTMMTHCFLGIGCREKEGCSGVGQAKWREDLVCTPGVGDLHSVRSSF